MNDMRTGHNLFDVEVIGGGVAALCAAISARLAGATVCLREAASPYLRGGNTRHSRNLRVMHPQATRIVPGFYSEEEFIGELEKTSNRTCDAVLTRILVQKSCGLPEWLAEQGVAFQTEQIPFSRKTAFFLGGGRAAVNSLYQRAASIGIHITYNHLVSNIFLQKVTKSTIICCGGNQACFPPEIINRGTPFARGEVLESLLDQGAQEIGIKEAGHIVAVDARSPEHDGGIVTRIDGMEHGIVVDRTGLRFQDETAYLKPTRYSLWGRSILKLPGKYAVLILDREGIRKAPVFAFPPIQSSSIEELAKKLDIPEQNLVASMNQTSRLSAPPFFALPIRPGIAFTHYGIKVDETAHVVMKDGTVCKNLFAAGMIMAPNILGTGYLAGAGITIGAVFGRIAGEEAARYALG